MCWYCFLEKSKNYGDWYLVDDGKFKDSDEVDFEYKLYQGVNESTIYVVNTKVESLPIDQAIEIIKALKKHLCDKKNFIEKRMDFKFTAVAFHQGLLKIDENIQLTELYKIADSVFQYSLGFNSVAPWPDAFPQDPPKVPIEINGKTKELGIAEILKKGESYYRYLPNLFKGSEEIAEQEKKTANITSLQLSIAALKILLSTRQVVDSTATRLLESLNSFLNSTANFDAAIRRQLGLEELEKAFREFQTKEGATVPLKDDFIKKTKELCNTIIQHLEDAKKNKKNAG